MNGVWLRTGRRTLRGGAVAGVIGLTIAGMGCEKMQLLAPTASTITISVPAQVLELGGSTQVQALVIEEAGTPVHNGTTVRFSTSLGRLEPVEAQTRNGVATTTFFAGSVSGIAAIRAVSGGATPGEDASNVVEVTVGAAAASAVVLSANPSSVPATGGSVTLTASVVDESGNRLSNIPVSFSTTAGSLSAGSAITDSTGEARVTLTTDRAATVTARAGSATATASITVATPPGIAISVPSGPRAGVAMVMTVTITVATGNPVPQVTVDWGDGSTEGLGIVTGARGVAHTYSSEGTYIITVSATADGNTTSSAAAVTVVP